MNAYPKYKTIAFEYVTQIPEDWDLLPNIAIFEERNEKGHIHEELLSVTIGKGVIKQSELNKKDSSNPDKSNYKLVEIGDIVYSMRFRQGASGYSNYKGLVSNACTVLKPKMKINPKFFHYQYRLPFYQNYAERYSYGIADGQKPLRWQDFKRMYAFVPPLETQNQIVTYLEEKEKQIKQFVKKKNRIVDLTENQLNSLVFGKNKYTDFKDWKDLFNTSWKIEKAKWVFSERNIKNHPSERLLASTQDRGLVFKDEIEENYVTATQTDGLKLVCKNDFVISLRSFEGGIELSEVQGITSPAYNIFYLKKEFNDIKNLKYYYKYLFKSNQFIGLLNTVVSGIREGKNISFKDFRELYIPIPDKKTIDKIYKLHLKLIDSKALIKKENELSKKLLTSLIENIIIGKMKVPNTYNSKKDTISIAAESVNTYNTP
ncbi:restriction endonuclease subunit S [Kordia algicida OT-1]|uniref:Type I restriction-modification system, S subunit n=1 Tax=Kordia algicida OT-1 TaxID=391587 RepID=A9DR74_9FLAO|nr:restriction endonuclease subunit S [Kordia algicida]EDP96751.1 type I restriction-modification system, S subunit [Kordia algicida OT-1]